MKEIKFKAFHKKTKEIYHVSFINFDRGAITLLSEKTTDGGWYTIEPLRKVVMMMYTNLKDNFGTEIYEDDIVEHFDGEYYFVGVVTYSPFGWYVKSKQNNISFEHFADEINGIADCKVIGNIHEVKSDD